MAGGGGGSGSCTGNCQWDWNGLSWDAVVFGCSSSGCNCNTPDPYTGGPTTVYTACFGSEPTPTATGPTPTPGPTFPPSTPVSSNCFNRVYDEVYDGVEANPETYGFSFNSTNFTATGNLPQVKFEYISAIGGLVVVIGNNTSTSNTWNVTVNGASEGIWLPGENKGISFSVIQFDSIRIYTANDTILNEFLGEIYCPDYIPTPTPTPSVSPSPTPSASASPTPTPSASPSPSPSASATPTPTPSPSPSPSASATPTPSPSPSPSNSATPTPSPSPSASVTTSPTPSPSFSATPTPTPTQRQACDGYNLWLFGDNTYGQLGDNTVVHRSSPVQIGTSEWCLVDTGIDHTGAIKKDGTLWLWGRNNQGQVGDNSIFNRSSPVQVYSNSVDWQTVSCGNKFTLALQLDGSLWAWGDNTNCTLGDRTKIHRSVPVQNIYSPVVGWSKVSAGYDHACAIDKSGRLYCWGNNSDGELGIGNTVENCSPVQILSNSTDWSDVATGQDFTLALKTDGSIWGWGKNAFGQYGNSTTQNTSSPIQVLNATSNWTAIAAGARFGAGLSLFFPATPTPSPSPSASATVTPTPTSTTATPTPTPLPSSTAPTPTPTGTGATATPTPSSSPTPTPTPSSTAPTPTPDPTNPPTPTATPEFLGDLNVHYRIYANVGITLPVNYDVGFGITYAYRVETYPRYLQQPLSSFSMDYNGPAKTVLNIFATNLKDLVQKILEIPYVWPVKSIEKYTKPIHTVDQRYLQSLGLYDPNDVRWVPVNLKDLPKEAEDLLVQYIGSQHAKMSMGYVMVNSEFLGYGSVFLRGSANYSFKDFGDQKSGSGKIYINGQAGINSVDLLLGAHKTGSGSVTIFGTAPYDTSYLGEIVTAANMIQSIEYQNTIVLIDPIQTDFPQIQKADPTTTISSCGCNAIPTYFGINHNLNNDSSFYRFIYRNNLTLTDTVTVFYNTQTKGYTSTQQFQSDYDNEKWTLNFDLNCSNELSNFSENSIWILTLTIKKFAASDSGETVFRAWIPSYALCPIDSERKINFSMIANLVNKTGVVNSAYAIKNIFINDGLKLFASNYWLKTPYLILRSRNVV